MISFTFFRAIFSASIDPVFSILSIYFSSFKSFLISSEQITSALFGYGSFDYSSVKNSSKALFYFAYGLPAFALIKVFSSYIFARHNTKVPFIISIYSVIINVCISLYFFSDIGFIIIPIATTISSWFNTTVLFGYLIKKKYFVLDSALSFSIFKIIFSSITTSFLFYQLIRYFNDLLIYESQYKLLTIILIIILTFIIYMLISILTKAFKMSDIKLKY